jgi:hypothetical protein
MFIIGKSVEIKKTALVAWTWGMRGNGNDW